MRFVPYSLAETEPNVVVDGAAAGATVLTLSHWPGAPTPPALKADTSAEIVLRHLAAPEVADLDPAVDAVTNNHVDEDGLLGAWALVAPKDEVWAVAERIVGASRAGDFGVVAERVDAEVAFALQRMAHQAEARHAEAPDTVAAVYEELIPVVGAVLRDPGRFERHWRAAVDAFEADVARLSKGDVALEERPAVDLAIVDAPVDPNALRTATRRMRLLHVPRDRRYRLEYRYETWVQYVSRPLAPRVDLGPLARTLQSMEDAPGRWTFDGVADIAPELRLEGADGEAAPSRIAPEAFVEAVVAYLEAHQGEPGMTWRPGVG